MHRVVFGVHAVYEALRMHHEGLVHIVICQDRTSRNLDKILNLSREYQIPVIQKNRRDFEHWFRSLNQGEGTLFNHQGVAAELRRQLYLSLGEVLQNIESQKKEGFLVLLDEINDPHNLGALIRSSACAGVDAVIIPKKGAAQVTPIVTKVSAGGIEHVSVCRVPNIGYALKDLSERGYLTVGMSPDASESIFEAELEGSIAVVIGSEELGIKKIVEENCQKLLKIPMLGELDSLNASVAGGIALFEIVRQRLKSQKKS